MISLQLVNFLPGFIDSIYFTGFHATDTFGKVFIKLVHLLLLYLIFFVFYYPFAFPLITPTNLCTVVPGHISDGFFLPSRSHYSSFCCAIRIAFSSLPALLIFPYIFSSALEYFCPVLLSYTRPNSVGHFLRTVHTCYPFLFSAPAFTLV